MQQALRPRIERRQGRIVHETRHDDALARHPFRRERVAQIR